MQRHQLRSLHSSGVHFTTYPFLESDRQGAVCKRSVKRLGHDVAGGGVERPGRGARGDWRRGRSVVRGGRRRCRRHPLHCATCKWGAKSSKTPTCFCQYKNKTMDSAFALSLVLPSPTLPTFPQKKVRTSNQPKATMTALYL